MTENQNKNSEISSFLDILSPLRRRNNSSDSNISPATDTPDKNQDENKNNETPEEKVIFIIKKIRWNIFFININNVICLFIYFIYIKYIKSIFIVLL